MIRDLHQKLINKEITAVQLAEQYFDNIEKKEKDIFAYLTLTKEMALEQAKKVDAKIARGETIGLIEGIPGAIKDNICIKGVRTTAASKILDNYIAPYDATVIKKLKESGVVFLGKTNLDEFAMGSSTEKSAYGPTKNPTDTDRVPGGSSGGSAAAVAAEEAVWALGSDTGGSIRQPASFCGVVGLKPTYGRVSRYGLLSMASSLDQIGPIARSVEDVAIILNEISGEDASYDATSAKSSGKRYENYLTGDIRGIKIGVVKEYMENLSADAKKAMDEAIESFKNMGAEIKEINLPYAKYALPIYYIIMSAEVSSNLARFDGIKYGMRVFDFENSEIDFVAENRNLLEIYLDSRRYGLGEEVKRRIMLGTYTLSSGYYDAYYLRAQKVRTLVRKDFEKVFDEVDIILTPTTPSPAFKFGERNDDPVQMYLEDIFTVTANIAGIPAISFPGRKIGPLPFGIQLMGKWFDEEGLLNAAYAFEQNKK
jgi:aspartyl-tRNA(Asn)/glutamyl-tRNA(Gln) amidotransferase subunit A